MNVHTRWVLIVVMMQLPLVLLQSVPRVSLVVIFLAILVVSQLVDHRGGRGDGIFGRAATEGGKRKARLGCNGQGR